MFVNLFQTLRASDRAGIAALVLAFWVLAGTALTADLPPDGDDVSYVTLARSLAAGRGYLNTIYPGDPPELQYPPVLPLLLAPVVALFGPRLLLLKGIPALAGGLALVAVFALLRPRLGPGRALLIAALTAGNGYYLSLSTQVMSETVYLTMSAAGLLLIRRAVGAGGVRRAVIAGIVIALAAYTRTIGLALILAAFATLFVRGRRREALVLAGVVALLFLPWVWRSFALQNSYLYQLFDLPLPAASAQSGPWLWLSRVLYNAPRYAGKVSADLFFHPFLAGLTPYHPLKIALSLAVTACIAAGFIARIRETVANDGSRVTGHESRVTDVEVIYLSIYVCICLVWPYHDARFLLPVLPFLWEHLLRGAEDMGRRVRLTGLARETAGLMGAVGLAGCVTVAHDNHAHFYTEEMTRFREACAWVGERTPPEAVVLCRKPREAAYWSGRKAWWYTGTQSSAEVLGVARRTGATHLMINDFHISGVNLAERFASVLREEGAHFRLIHRTDPPCVSIYEVLRIP